MIINPAIIALICSAILSAGFCVYAVVWGSRIIRHWDLKSGSTLQLQLERRTYLISTIMTCLLSAEIFNLFLFIYTADHIHPIFIGAMCAAGSLNVNGFGYPTLLTKIITLLCCGIWLVVNQADNRAEDYPLIRFKYKLLFCIAGLLVLGALLQIAYFKGLKAEVITTCCGTLFNTDAENIAGGIAGLPDGIMRIAFFTAAALHLRSAVHLLASGRGGQILGWVSAVYFLAATLSVISFISVYYYELPTHHCPFDILQSDYRYVGYPLYGALFVFAVSGMAVGVLDGFTALPSLSSILPGLMRRYAWISLFAGLIFLAISAYPMVFSDFKLPI